jgi:hypothetical protein
MGFLFFYKHHQHLSNKKNLSGTLSHRKQKMRFFFLSGFTREKKIRKIVSSVLFSKKKKNQKKKMPFTCAICLSEPKHPVVTRCAHLFCWNCLDTWASARGHRTVPCPTCNGAVDIDHEVTPIYGTEDDQTTPHPAMANRGTHAQSQNSHQQPPNPNPNPYPNAYPGQQYFQQQQHRPPPQPQRRADPAPPPINRNPFAGLFGAGNGIHWQNPLRNVGGAFFPFIFFSFGGGMFESLITFAVLSFGYYLVANLWNNNNNNQNQQNQNHHQQQNPVFRFHDRVREWLLQAGRWLMQNWHIILWIIFIFSIINGADYLFGASTPDYASMRRQSVNQNSGLQNRHNNNNNYYRNSARPTFTNTNNNNQRSNNNDDNHYGGVRFFERNHPNQRHNTYGIMNMLFDVLF